MDRGPEEWKRGICAGQQSQPPWQPHAAEYPSELASETRPQPSGPMFVPLEAVPVWTPDLELVNFGEDRLTLGDVLEGVAIFGSTGSGKTSGSGRTLACSYLKPALGV